MTETKKNKLPEPIPVDGKKLIDGLGTIFGGVIQLLNSMEPGMAQQLADMAINGVPKEQKPEDFNPDDFEEIIAADGEVGNVDVWGMRKLAYPIQKKSEGYYVVIEFKAEPTLPKELDRRLKISDNVMRHLIDNKDQK